MFKKIMQNFSKYVNQSNGLNNLLHNRTLLYSILIVSLLHLFYYINTKDNKSVFIFIIVGFLTSFFSKNMNVILVTALIVTHIMKYIDKKSFEGLTNEDDEEEVEEVQEEFQNEENTEEEEVEEVQEEFQNEEEQEEEQEEEVQENMEDINKDFSEFKKIQEDIYREFQKMDPIINKAEAFVEKYKQKYT